MSFLSMFFGNRGREKVSVTVPGIEGAIEKSFPANCIRRALLEAIPGGVQLVLVEFKNGHFLEQVPIRSQDDWEVVEARMAMLYDLPPL
jgi:hypothetical protein